MKRNWRPDGWYRMIESPFMHDGVKMAREDPERALELELQHQAFRLGQEAGADAMLEAIWKSAKESPTGTFTFDINTINVFRGLRNEYIANKRGTG